MREINGKAAITDIQIKDRVEKGATSLEIHLLKNQLKEKREIKPLSKRLLSSSQPINVIHSPIMESCSVESLHNSEGHAQMTNVMAFAQKVAEAQERTVTVVLHQSLRFKELNCFKMLPGITRQFATCMEEFLHGRVPANRVCSGKFTHH